MYTNLVFKGVLKPDKVIISNLNLSKLGFIRKCRPKRFHKIDPRTTTASTRCSLSSVSWRTRLPVQRPVLTTWFTLRGKFAPRSELSPQGWTFSPRGNVHPFVHPQGWTLSTVEKNRGANREFHSQGITSPLGDKVQFWGTTSPWGSKFAPRGEVKNGPQFLSNPTTS
jgi:hypothetical protein